MSMWTHQPYTPMISSLRTDNCLPSCVDAIANSRGPFTLTDADYLPHNRDEGGFHVGDDNADNNDSDGTSTEGDPTPRMKPKAILDDAVSDDFELDNSVSKSSSVGSRSNKDNTLSKDKGKSTSRAEPVHSSAYYTRPLEKYLNMKVFEGKLEGGGWLDNETETDLPRKDSDEIGPSNNGEDEYVENEEDMDMDLDLDISDNNDVDFSYNDENDPVIYALSKHDDQVGKEFCSQDEAFGRNSYFTKKSVKEILELNKEPCNSYITCMRLCRKITDITDKNAKKAKKAKKAKRDHLIVLKDKILQAIFDSIHTWISQEHPEETLALGRAKFALLGQLIRVGVFASNGVSVIVALLDEYSDVKGFMNCMQALFWYAGCRSCYEENEEDTMKAVNKLRKVLNRWPDDPERFLMYKKITHAVEVYSWRVEMEDSRAMRTMDRFY